MISGPLAPRSRCTCGHVGDGPNSQHLGLMGHGACNVKGCDCEKFTWSETQRREIVQKSDLDWVFSNATEVLNHPHRASIQALARCFGLSDMWGPNGEGITYIYNAHYTLELARPFLEHANKEGWLQFAEKIRNARKEGT